jgi:hypothetical protein
MGLRRTILFAASCGLLLIFCLPRQGASRLESGGDKGMLWAPPDVDAPIPSLSSIPPCDLSKVLAGAARHASELNNNLERFSAEENIQYEMTDPLGFRENRDASVFNYAFAFEQNGGVRTSREYRTPAKGGHNFDASGQDTGQVALALIFLPNMQSDYEMNCEGLDKWNGTFAWVIRFKQRKDQPRRTMAFHVMNNTYKAMLKGRAWISMDKEQLLCLETTLMHDIPDMRIDGGTISVEYAPVEVESKKLQLWLPKRIEAYWKIASHRVILYHTFDNFKVFSVDTQQNIEKPKTQQPQPPQPQ